MGLLLVVFIVIGTIVVKGISPIHADEGNYILESETIDKEHLNAIPIKLTIEKPKEEELFLEYTGIIPIVEEDFETVEAVFQSAGTKLDLKDSASGKVKLHMTASNEKFVWKFYTSLSKGSENFSVRLVSESGQELAKIENDYSELIEQTEKKSEENETPQSSEVVGIEAPTGIEALAVPLPPTTHATSVSNWDEYKAAALNPAIDQIDLTNNLTANTNFGGSGSAADSNSIKRNLVINGHGFMITQTAGTNFTRLGPLSSGTTANLYVVNLVLKHNTNTTSTGSYFGYRADATTGAAMGTGWKVYFDDVDVVKGGSNGTTFGAYGLIDLPQADCFISGTSDFEKAASNTTNGNDAFIRAKSVIVEENATIVGTIGGGFFYSSDNDSSVIFKNSTVDFGGLGTVTFIRSKDLLISGGTFTFSPNDANDASFYRANIMGSTFQIDKRAQVEISVNGANAIGTDGLDSVDSNNNKAKALDVLFYGDNALQTHEGNTHVTIQGKSVAVADSGGIINFDLKPGTTNGTLSNVANLLVKDYATVEMKSLGTDPGANGTSGTNGTPIVMFQGLYSTFKSSNHSKLMFYQYGGSNALAGAIRFRYAGHCNFIVEEDSQFDVLKQNHSSPGIRMSGENNKIEVSSGSAFYLRNMGTGSPGNPGMTSADASPANNAGIVFPQTDYNLESSKFIADGENSVVKIYTPLGPVIDTRGNVDVQITDGGTYEAIGKTNGASLYSSNRGSINFLLDKPLYYDIRNDATSYSGQTLISTVNNSYNPNNKLEVLNSNAAFWKNNTNLDSAPFYERYGISYKITGQNFTTIANSPDVDFSTKLGNGGINQFSRISGNNAPPIVTWVHLPTNADKSVYAQVYSLKGFDENGERIYGPAVKDEAYVVFKLTYPDATVEYVTGRTQDSVNIYGDTERGVAKATLSNNKFIPTGTKVEVTNCWRGPAAGGNDASYPQAKPEDISALPKPVAVDVTPPTTPVSTEVLSNATKTISGTSDEDGSKVFAKVNGQWLKDSGGNLVTTTVASGKWTLSLADYLLKDDVVDIYLKDTSSVTLPPVVDSNRHITADFQHVVGLPTTQTEAPDTVLGNLEVAIGEGTSYHDKTDMAPALRLAKVKDVLPQVKVGKHGVLTHDGVVTTGRPQVGDVILYTVTFKNEKADSILKNVESTDELTQYVEDCREVKLDGNSLSTSDYSIIDNLGATATTHPKILKATIGDIAYNVTKTLTFKVTINSESVNHIIENTNTGTGETPQLENGPQATDGIYLKVSDSSSDTGLPGQGTVLGTIGIIKYPKKVDFGNHFASTKDAEYLKPDYDPNQLTIQDTRAGSDKQNWKLKLQLAKDFTLYGDLDNNSSTPDEYNPTKQLTNVLYFRSGSSDTLVDTSGIMIAQETNHSLTDATVNWDVMNEWTTTHKGLIMKVSTGSVKEVGQYRAELNWILESTP